MTDIGGANIGIHSNSRDLLVVLNVHDVKNQSINEQERAVLERCVNSILYLHKKIAEMRFQCTNISLLHMYRVHLPLPELYRQYCADFIECNVEHQK